MTLQRTDCDKKSGNHESFCFLSTLSFNYTNDYLVRSIFLSSTSLLKYRRLGEKCHTDCQIDCWQRIDDTDDGSQRYCNRPVHDSDQQTETTETFERPNDVGDAHG